MLQRFILLWLVLSSAIAWGWPELTDAADPFVAAGNTQGVLSGLVILTMFCVGTALPIEEVNQLRKRWATVLAGTAVQYITMPLLAWGVVSVLSPDPGTAAGILIVGCVPGAMASNVLTLTARGNVSYSVSLTTAATLLSPIVVPLTLWLTIDSSGFDGVAAIKTMVQFVVAPVVVGHLCSRRSTQARRIAKSAAGSVANLAILAIIAIIVAKQRANISQTTVALLGGLAVINVCGYLAGYLSAATFGSPEKMRRALTLEVGMQNAGTGVVLAQKLFPEDSAALVPCALYTFGCMLTGTILATFWHLRPPGDEGGSESADNAADSANDNLSQS